jgi:hypothetical protein
MATLDGALTLTKVHCTTLAVSKHLQWHQAGVIKLLHRQAAGRS